MFQFCKCYVPYIRPNTQDLSLLGLKNEEQFNTRQKKETLAVFEPICTTHSDIMPPRIDAPRSADLLYTVVRYRYTVLTVGKHEDHCLRRPITKAIYPGPWGRHESNP